MSFSMRPALWMVLSLALFSSYVEAQQIGGLDQLSTVVDRRSHRSSSYDRTGDNMDNVLSFAPGAVHTLLDTDGPGKVTHLWLTISAFPNHEAPLRDLVIRMYWEGSETPSVEVPLGEFFGLGHGREYQVHTLPINVGSNERAFNCYWPMPFYKHARIELVNTGQRSIRRLYFNLDYELGPIPPDQGLFHAEFHREAKLKPQSMVGNTSGKENYVLLDTKGTGHYVGCFMFIDSAPGGWWGEGDEMMYLDGEATPSIIGTGTEDYFGNAWGFDGISHHLFYGTPLLSKLKDGWTQTTIYRLHVPDPVRFDKSLRVTMEHAWPGGIENDYSSIVFWYQTKPSTNRPPLLAWKDNRPHVHVDPKAKQVATSKVINGTELEPALRAHGDAIEIVTTGHAATLGGGYVFIEPKNGQIELPLPSVLPGTYEITVLLTDSVGPVSGSLAGESAIDFSPAKKEKLVAQFAKMTVTPDQPAIVTLHTKNRIGLESVKLKLVD